MSASIDMTRLIQQIAAGGARAIAAAKHALDVGGLHVLGDAQQLAPVDTGALKASATDEPATWSGNSLTKVIGFNTEYAAAVHERLDAKHAVPTQAKFLETAMRNGGPKVISMVAAAVKAVTESGPGNVPAAGKDLNTGSRGGKYHLSASGKKVYHKR